MEAQKCTGTTTFTVIGETVAVSEPDTTTCKKRAMYRADEVYRNRETGKETDRPVYFCLQHWDEYWGHEGQNAPA